MSIPVNLDLIRDAIPAGVRRWIYLGWGLLLIAALATQVGFAAAEVRQPVQLTVVLAVLSYLGIVVAALAVVNTKPVEPVVALARKPIVLTEGPQGPYVAHTPGRALDADEDGEPDYADEGH